MNLNKYTHYKIAADGVALVGFGASIALVFFHPVLAFLAIVLCWFLWSYAIAMIKHAEKLAVDNEIHRYEQMLRRSGSDGS